MRTHASFSALLLALLPLCGCSTVIEAPSGQVDRYAVYQTIANALPEADFGWGSPPGIAEMSASAKAEDPLPSPEDLKANERGFRVRYQPFRMRTAWIPYEAIKEVQVSWEPVPNVFFAALIILPLQIDRCTVVFDATKVEGMLPAIEADAARLEGISREIGLGGPWSHAQELKYKLQDDAQRHGAGHLALHFDLASGVPAWIPVHGAAGDLAEAFAWAAANPSADVLPDREEPASAE